MSLDIILSMWGHRMWTDEILDRLSRQAICGYAADSPATEPTALTTLALVAGDARDEAGRGAGWLAEIQQPNGAVGVRPDLDTPIWPTSLAVLAWLAVARAGIQSFQNNVDAGIKRLLDVHGKIIQSAPYLGHDTRLVGWPWAEGTHSWVEPTALSVLALKAAGFAEHSRTREAVRLLIDRQLPSGGCNCGNTIVLGQELRAHVQPTGMSLVALAGEHDPAGKLAGSVEYLHQHVSNETTAVSLAWASLGLAAFGEAVRDDWLEQAHRRLAARAFSGYAAALLYLAAAGSDSPLIELTHHRRAHEETSE